MKDLGVFDRLTVLKGDITQITADAIVNAAAPHLLGGEGVDGAIHKAAGPELLGECRGLKGCRLGEAKITKGYRLPCKHIIHTVGPVYDHFRADEQLIELKSCYVNSIKLAKEHGLKTIAFPCIANGIYGFPIRLSVDMVFETCLQALKEDNELKIYLVCYEMSAYEQYVDCLVKIKSNLK